MSNHEVDAIDGFVAITDANLARLAKGCFVRVGMGEDACWVEIHYIDGDRLIGAVHPELSVVPGPVHDEYCAIASIRHEQITALGCDRYCFC